MACVLLQYAFERDEMLFSKLVPEPYMWILQIVVYYMTIQCRNDACEDVLPTLWPVVNPTNVRLRLRIHFDAQ